MWIMLDRNGCATMLAAKRSAGVAPEAQVIKRASEAVQSGFETRVTKSQKTGV